MLLLQIQNDDPPSPRKLNGAVPRDLETIALKCLAKEPARRYATALELAAELERWLAGEPIHARPSGPDMAVVPAKTGDGSARRGRGSVGGHAWYWRAACGCA